MLENVSSLSSEVLIWVLVPGIAAAIGWFTNYIAIKLLFHPRKPKKLLLFTLHGVFPKRQAQLATKLGELFSETLGVRSKIVEAGSNLMSLDGIENNIVDRVKTAAIELLQKDFPMLVALVPPDVMDKLSTNIGAKIRAEIESKVSSSADSLVSKINIKKIVEDQILALDSDELEVMLKELLHKEFKFIELSGAILGFFIGCVQVAVSRYLLEI